MHVNSNSGRDREIAVSIIDETGSSLSGEIKMDTKGMWKYGLDDTYAILIYLSLFFAFGLCIWMVISYVCLSFLLQRVDSNKDEQPDSIVEQWTDVQSGQMLYGMNLIKLNTV